MPDRTKATEHADGLDGGVAPARRVRPPHVDLGREPRGALGRPLGREPLVAALDPARRSVVRRARSIPHPTCSLTVELGSHPRAGMPPGETVVVTGVCTRRFDVEVRGWGRVLGLRMRPGGLTALTGRPHRPGPTGRSRRREVLPPALVAELADPDLVATGADVVRGGGTGPGRPGGRAGRPRATTCCSTSSPTCSPTTPCSRWPTSRTGTPSRCAPCSASSRTTSASARNGCSRATGCTTPSPTSTPGSRNAHRPRGALRLVRPGPLHP